MSNIKKHISKGETIVLVSKLNTAYFEDANIGMIKSKLYEVSRLKNKHASIIFSKLQSVNVGNIIFKYDNQSWETFLHLNYFKLPFVDKLHAMIEKMRFEILNTNMEVVKNVSLIDDLNAEKRWPDVRLKMLRLPLNVEAKLMVRMQKHF